MNARQRRMAAIIAVATVVSGLLLAWWAVSLQRAAGIGMHGHLPMLCLNAAGNATAMAFAVDGGVRCFRTDISLNQEEAAFVANETKAGADYLGILDYVTVGMQTSRYGCAAGCDWNLSDWNASVANALTDYPEIHEWEIYNEPLVGEFSGGYDNGNATHYFDMIRSAYAIIKSREPNATIVCFGGAQMFPISAVQAEYPFYEAVWSDGASRYCDAVSLHAYSLPYYSLGQVVYGRATLAQEWNYTLGLYENLTGKKVWITETGIPSNNWTRGLELSEQKQASFLTQDIGFFASHPYVSRVYWFHLLQGGSGGADYGLLNRTTLAPKPAWYDFVRLLGGSYALPTWKG